jgi:acetyl-CoA carboxylase, biotin carboxylase subunit
MEHEAFRSGNFDTRFIENYFSAESLRGPQDRDESIIAALLSIRQLSTNTGSVNGIDAAPEQSLWKKNRL